MTLFNNTKHSFSVLASALLCAGFSATPVDAAEFFDDRLKVNALFMQGFQNIEADPGAFDPINENMSAGFQRLRFNLELTFKITDDITAFVDLGEEPNDFGSDDKFEISQDFGYIDFNVLGLLKVTDTPHELHVKAGNIESSVFDFRGFSDGAAVQNNPLIGNSIADFVTAESGVQVAWAYKLQQYNIDKVNANITVTVPTFDEDYGDGRGYNVFGDVSVNTDFGLDLGIGWFVSDLGGQVGLRDFADIQVAGLIFGDGDNYNFVSSGNSSRDTHAGLLPGLNVTIVQLNSQYRLSENTLFRGWFGTAEDDYSFVDVNGNQAVATQGVAYAAISSKMRFFGLEASHYIIPDKLYLATRFSQVSNETEGVSGDTDLTRLQLGAGWWLAENTLLKAEWVEQREGANSAGQIGTDWGGFTAEVSVRF
ncbi:hypothetical protein LMJ53_06230 [Rheinheimera sp. UJ51]|uniref:hypothetical protein n=1 Tax=Rheinheimera sp. UJ51 TaxID=2892446 RepID=UPI001E5D56D6|nr:hypothetical protein [Rheinheimera sp. UJ51]MCC5451330.1 hypothetical protein [Rheinheimera sp. UJ51]